MSMTAYEVQTHGHDRNGDDYGYVNIMYRYGGKMPCPDRIGVRRWRSCGQTRAFMGRPPPAVRWGIL
ncbi:MAG: hypothetical protein V8R75_12065 [Oscillospiraceae bacterium]